MFSKLRKKITKKVHKHIHKHIYKYHCKHVHKFLHITHHIHNHLGHTGELLLLSIIFISNFISSGFSPAPKTFITDHTIIASNLLTAINQGTPKSTDPKIISMRQKTSNVDNSFYPGYCTYGAALISPEFFPYIEENKQQRAWGGNAIDRCENASATGYSIGSKAAEGAFIVYNQGVGALGHVGKVMFYNSSKSTLIIRDMNRIGKSIMTDRREDSTNANIKCYIYAKRTLLAINDITPTITQPVIVNTGATTINTGVIATQPIVQQIQPVVQPTQPQNPVSSIEIPVSPNPVSSVQIPVSSNLEPEESTTLQTFDFMTSQTNIGNIELNFENISDLAKHFVANRNIGADIVSKTIQVGSSTKLILTIQGKSGGNYAGLLQPPFEIIASNDNIHTDYTVIGFIKDGKVEVNIDGLQIGNSTIIINFGGEKIGQVNLTIN